MRHRTDETFLAGLVKRTRAFGLSPFGGWASRLFRVDARLRFPGEPVLWALISTRIPG
jgi:hypothetical protein